MDGFKTTGCALLLAVAAGARAEEGPAPLSFTDVTDDAGIALPGILTESLAWGDYDNDDDEDLYLTNNGINRLYRNDGDDVFTDVTEEAGVGDDGWGVGTAFGDLDNDGDLDLYVVNFGVGSDVLYINNGPVGPKGAYTFTDITMDAGTTIERSSRGLAYVDYDRDGLLDLYVNAIGADLMYHNLGGLTFTDTGGLIVTTNPPDGQGVGVVATDVNDDGWVDLYNGNRSGDPSNLFLNVEGTLTDIAGDAGLAASGLGMGVLSFDYDNDLDMDLYWTTWPGTGKEPVANALYQNQGNLSFLEVAGDTGTEDPMGWGISCNAGDIDNDRWMDFFVTNGFDEGSGPNILFRNVLGVSFEDVSAVLGLVDYDGRGVAFADYDNDGDLDLALTGDTDDPNRLWRNDTDNGNHWVTLKLIGRASNRSAIGARVEVTAGGVTTVQEVSGGAGRGSFNSLPLEFGLAGAVSVDSVFLRWPRGREQTIEGVLVDTIVTITEPELADVNMDGQVDVEDLLDVIFAWGPCPDEPAPCPEDIDGDGDVDVDDLLMVILGWMPQSS
jgi:hypothetical protein